MELGWSHGAISMGLRFHARTEDGWVGLCACVVMLAFAFSCVRRDHNVCICPEPVHSLNCGAIFACALA